MSIQEYGRQVLDKGKQEIKNQIMKKLLPILLKYVAPVVIVLIILISILMGLFGGIEASAEESKMTPATGSSWEQFLRYVAIKEGGGTSGDYYVVEDDGAGNPTVGHGLCIKSSDGYLHVDEFATYGIDSKNLSIGDLVPKEICDAIWSNHIKGLYEGIVSTYLDLGLTEYQCYALTDVKYRRGNTNGFQGEYESKWTSSDDQYGNYNESSETFSTSTLFKFFWNGGHSLEGVNIRKKDQWVLFKYGYYRPLNEYWQESTTFSGDLYNEDGSVNEEKIAELQKSFESKYNLVEGNLSGNNIGGVYNSSACKQVTGDYLKWDGNVYSSGATYRGENGLGIYQCTWWANGRASQYLGKQFDVNGNGGEIFGNAQGKYKTGSTPKPNSLVSYYKNKTDGSSTTGHVAYVEAVDNQYYYISHCGSGKSWYGIQKVEIGKAPWNGWYIVGFVYLD